MGDRSQSQQSTSTPPPSSPAADSRRNAKGKSRPRYVEEVDNPTVEFLKFFGINVRDFAYEVILPPLAPYVRQPRPDPRNNAVAGPSSARAPRPLKRTRADGTEVEDNGYGFVMGVARTAPDASRPPKMPRLDTEVPGGSQASLPLRREATLLSLDVETELRRATHEMFGGSQSQSQGQSQGYYSQGNSQDTDEIPTPIVTPNGSLIWPDREPPLVPTEPASAAPTEPNSEQASTSSVPLALSESPTPASRRRASARPQPLRRASPFPSQLQLQPPSQLPPLPRWRTDTTRLSPPARCTPPLTINTTAPPPPPPVPTLARLDVQPLLRTFSSLSTFSSPLSEPPPSAPQQPRTPSPPPRYQLRKRSGTTASSARGSKRRRPAPPRREESLTLVIQS
ncbi:hypothetical protein MSAN_01469600 [Mycena sanguinolenta]|uniref:Uncharacterized protein n=1 Tax=Mycena sanguinolenta TaxID=230812 RepID=A0A8H7D1C8_9AGAR|nr:hypothetical protein MSAN_01469600 [Mycena sanguinolenta]